VLLYWQQIPNPLREGFGLVCLYSTILSRQATGAITNVDPALLMRFSERSWRAAQIVVSAIPILIIYPFVQRYFVTMRLGGIKG
jgi:ABC-type glycerol-3-phosphate transport system permease component